MWRNALFLLEEWLNMPNRKPLVLRGARQVGKTWLVKHFAKQQHKQLIEFNFEKNPELITLFENNDPKKVLLQIEASLNVSIDLNQTVLFLDEIQAAPLMLSKLRWFAEDMPELAVIAAGSLLEFVLEEHSFSMPVGRINYFHLEPLSFEEFLLAKNKNKLLEYLQNYQINDVVPEMIHQQLFDEFKEYIVIGGMPAAVSSWVENSNLKYVQQIHHDILATYQDDFAKYAAKSSINDLHAILHAVPKMLGHKFQYSKVTNDVRFPTLKKALSLLTKARVCHKIMATYANGIPLSAEIKENIFKVILLDVGLANSLLGLNLSDYGKTTNINLINQGSISEQVVGQLLRCFFPYYIEPQNYYWIRENKGSSAEIDYIIQHQSHLIPIEVKSGSTGSLKSLHLYMSLKNARLAVRINGDLPSLTKVDIKTTRGEAVHYTLLSIPFYLLQQLPRLLALQNLTEK